CQAPTRFSLISGPAGRQAGRRRRTSDQTFRLFPNRMPTDLFSTWATSRPSENILLTRSSSMVYKLLVNRWEFVACRDRSRRQNIVCSEYVRNRSGILLERLVLNQTERRICATNSYGCAGICSPDVCKTDERSGALWSQQPYKDGLFTGGDKIC